MSSIILVSGSHNVHKYLQIMNQSVADQPELFEKLDEVISGEVPKKIVDDIITELKRNDGLRKKFFRGIKNNPIEVCQ